MAHAVDLLVDRAFLLDIGVGPRHIGLGLVVVVVGDEILHRVLGKEALHLAIELGGQGLVRRQDQGRALQMLDDMGHGEGLARAGDAQQDLVALLALEPGDELDDGLGLVARGLVVGDDLEGHAPGRPRRPADEGQGAREGRSLGVAEHGQDIACDPPAPIRRPPDFAGQGRRLLQRAIPAKGSGKAADGAWSIRAGTPARYGDGRGAGT